MARPALNDRRSGPKDCNGGARLLARLAADRRGISGIEFALILPLIIVLFAATLDLGEGLMVSRRLDQISATISDIMTQESSWSTSAVETLVEGAVSILEPFNTDTVEITVSVLNVSSSGTATVAWSYGYHTAALTSGAASPVDIPANIAESGVQLVVTTVEHDITTTFTALLSEITGLDSYHLTSSAISRPRVGDTVSQE